MGITRLLVLIALLTVSCGYQPTENIPEPPLDIGPYDYNQPDIPAWEPDQYVVDCGTNGMCFVPAGPFWMGCNSDFDYNCEDDESPYHEVTLSAYYIDRTEVTELEYSKCVNAGECHIPGTSDNRGNWNDIGRVNNPVNCVNRIMAGKYCSWVGKRLPTEAEWEKAARGTDGRKYPWGNTYPNLDLAAFHPGTGDWESTGTSDVCTKSPAGDSPYGLCDMAGNVREWVADWYLEDYYSISPLTDPSGPSTGDTAIVRGGDGGSSSLFVRVSSRGRRGLEVVNAENGFRCVLSAQ
jgi:formylglycine-generating enzyme required for sulfatase activity